MKSSLWSKGSIFATFIVCCVILALLSSSLATDYWVTSTGQNNDTHAADINLGLFKGQAIKTVGLASSRVYDVKLVCLTNDTDSVCMFSCGGTAEDRTADLADLIYNDGQLWDQGANCDGHDVSAALRSDLLTRAAAGGGGGAPALLLTSGRAPFLPNRMELSDELLSDELLGVAEVPQTEPQFMSYGLWLSTIVMLAAAILFTLVAAMFAILNTATTPVETIFGVLGLYVWNAIAMVFELLALSIWGAQFHQHLQHSVLWREEMSQNWTTDGMASLGYSYWLVFVAMFLHMVNMGILWLGMHQMKPKTVKILPDRGADLNNMIY